jgi:integrase
MQLRNRGGYWWVEAKYWDDQTGKRKRVQRSTGIKDDGTPSAKRTANVVGEGIARSIALGQNRRARPDTIDDAFEANLKAKCLANCSDSTCDIVVEKSKHVIRFFSNGSLPVRDIDTPMLAKYATHALKTRKALTVQREMRELVAGIKALGMPGVKLPNLGKSIYRPCERWLNAEQTRLLLEEIREERREHVLTYRLLGLRKSELFTIHAHDVNLEMRTVRVNGTKTPGARRLLPLSGDMLDLFTRRVQQFPTGPLFESWKPNNADRELRGAAQRAGLGPISFNDLRRSFATELAMKGVAPFHLAKLLGHKSTKMVEFVYARVNPGELHTVTAQLEGYAPSVTALSLPFSGQGGQNERGGLLDGTALAATAR